MRATKSSLRAVKCITKRKKVTNQNQKYCLMQDVFIRWKLHIILSLDDRSCPRYSRRYKYNELNKWFRSRIQPSVLYFLKAINMCYKYNAKSEIYGLGLTTSNPPPPPLTAVPTIFKIPERSRHWSRAFSAQKALSTLHFSSPSAASLHWLTSLSFYLNLSMPFHQ